VDRQSLAPHVDASVDVACLLSALGAMARLGLVFQRAFDLEMHRTA
jgi:hypothetical protein